MKTQKMLKYLFVMALVGCALFLSLDVQAQDLTSVSDTSGKNIKALIQPMGIFFYVVAFGFAAAGLFKLKAYSETKGQVPVSQSIWLFVVAAGLVAIPTLLSISSNSLFGSGAKKTTLDGGIPSSI